MAAVTPSTLPAKGNEGSILVFYGTGASNTDATLTTPVIKEHCYKVSYAAATYSGAATQAGVTFGVDSVIGSGYDATLVTSSANLRFSSMTTPNVILVPGDALVITALAGGSVTAAIMVVLERV